MTAVEGIVLPGEVVKKSIINRTNQKSKIIVGPGLKKRGDELVVSKCGIMKSRTPNVWVDSLQKQYTPTSNETVVGVVTKKTGDYYKVDIQAADQALLHYLSFEGATKKNRTEINVGDVIFGRLVVVSPDMEPELVCMTVNNKKESFGVCQDGFLFRVSLHLVRKLLSPTGQKLLKAFGDQFSKYESAIGMNGLIWIKARNIVDTIAISTGILKTETMTLKDISNYAAKLKGN